MSEMYENEAMENENQEESYEEVSKMKNSGTFKGKAVAFVAGVIACGVGALLYKHSKNKVTAEEFDDEDFDYEEEEALEELESVVDEEGSEESEEN